jgi:hypothetical protein
MAEALNYCDRCRERISPRDVEDGRAVVSASAAVCARCAAQLPPDVRDALVREASAAANASRGTPAQGKPFRPARASPRPSKKSRASRDDRRSAERRSGRPPRDAQDARSGSAFPVLPLLLAAGIVLVIIVILVHAYGGSSSRRSPPHTGPSRRPAVEPSRDPADRDAGIWDTPGRAPGN